MPAASADTCTHWAGLDNTASEVRVNMATTRGISQRIMGSTTGTAVAKFDLSGMKPGQRAGFVRFGGVCHLIGVYAEMNGERRLFFRDNSGKEIKRLGIDGDDLFVAGMSDELWVFDGSGWSQVTRSGPWPSARRGLGATYDAERQAFVIYGGTDGGVLDDAWAWDGNSWTELCSACTGTVTVSEALASESVRRA